MKVEIKSLTLGAQEAKGIVVVIDVFRASDTILAMFDVGIKEIITTKTLTEARTLKKKFPTYLLCGERNRIKPIDFDYDNSPTTIAKTKVKIKKAILTTSAGSQAIINATKADEIIIGCFRNAEAVKKYIKRKKSKRVSLIAIGTNAKVKAIEDELCAEYLKALLEGETPDFKRIKKEILKSKTAKEVKKIKNGADLRYCLRLNTDTIIPRVTKSRGLHIISF
jgi:2-phosphosulfolactate phosphatase